MRMYDVIIVGGGPAGLFTALELIDKKDGLDILLLEKGKDIQKRICPINAYGSKCTNCKPCAITCGIGGAGAFSDGKLTLTSEFGGVLDEYMPKSQLNDLINYVDSIYVKFGGTTEVHGTDREKIREIEKRAQAADLKLIPAVIKHLGTEKCFDIIKNMRDYIGQKVEIKTETPVAEIIVENGKAKGVVTEKGEEYYGKYIVVVPGREGAEWFKREADRLGLETKNNAVDIGVRVEIPAVVMEDITKEIYESKFIYYSKSFDDRVRTFCMNPYGKVVIENNNGIKTVNGHSYKDIKTDNTNFAILVSKEFTHPFNRPIEYGRYIAELANMLGDGVIVQRLGDLLAGRRSTPERIKRGLVEPTLKDATPGDLSLVLPYRFLQSIIEMLQALDKVSPGVYSKHTLLYGVEVKFYSSRVKLTDKFETQIQNLFAAGDGAGITRGLAQASVSGVVVAREILERVK
ncbi:FAD dependent oxidoreductase [Thermoanaerobacter italicus Ab9]|uniref:FAD dependent oxidoreductase n=1 Tax=Thermoanaerobacter italicus (strain DSM 9252 / Ab9) TaxID=580331 RepID=D3T6D4_THEIA|nr:NAD(P)/FAD-dependent oxidoreductase [Thermoanaerobacter italicus]ADD03528.1 FAD dependent oxidoreductase [Thermoanaerobacter italicus Ab9]